MNYIKPILLLLPLLAAGCGDHMIIPVDPTQFAEKQGVVVTSSHIKTQTLLPKEGAQVSIDNKTNITIPWGDSRFIELNEGEHSYSIWFNYIGEKAGVNSGCFTVSNKSTILLEYKTPLLVTSNGYVHISALTGNTYKATCTPNKSSPTYQEFLIGGFNPKEWIIGNQFSDQNQRVIEFVRNNESIDSWTELFTSQIIRKPPNIEPIDVFIARLHDEDRKLCPEGFEQKVIVRGQKTDTEEASFIYEWEMKDCDPNADQHEVAKIIYGKFSIFRLAYVERTKKLSPEKRQKWINNLKEAKIVVSK